MWSWIPAFLEKSAPVPLREDGLAFFSVTMTFAGFLEVRTWARLGPSKSVANILDYECPFG